MAALRYQVLPDIYDPKSMQDETNFYHQRQGKPDELTKKLVYILGSQVGRYPISMQTMSSIAPKGASVGVTDVQFTYPTMGRLDKACPLVESCVAGGSVNAAASPGLNNSEFKLRFGDNWIKRQYILTSPRGVQAYVLGDPEKIGDVYEYTLQLDAVTDDAFVPDSELASGMAWAELNVNVPESESRPSESKSVAPGEYKNQLGFTKVSLSWAGNAAEKVMKINVKTDKGETNVWMDFFMWQFEKRWLEELEHMYWYSRYNRKDNGTITLKDKLTGKVIPRGSGLLEQIQNKSTYTQLSYDGISKRIGQALFGIDDAESMAITLYTGKGGIREFDAAMKEQGKQITTDFSGIADKFVIGSGREMMLTGFFNGFYHVDGYIVKVKHHPIFDTGRIAQAQKASGLVHPDTGFPLESYRMVYIDDASIDGQPNIQHVYEKGRLYQHGVVMGLTNVPKSLQIAGGFDLTSNALQRLTDGVDKSSYVRFKSQGVQLLRGNRCFDLECVRGL